MGYRPCRMPHLRQLDELQHHPGFAGRLTVARTHRPSTLKSKGRNDRMLPRTQLKVGGAGICAALLLGGHSVLTVHASPVGDATLVADAAAVDALDMTADALTWTDPNTTCGPGVNGHPVTDGVDVGVAQVSAEEAAEADI